MKSLLILFLILAAPALQAETIVTTYVTKVQEERQSTRWTLTEWLRIKERMKLMDVWLAMFSSPEQDVFSPEFNLAYSQSRGHLISTGAVSGSEQNTEGSLAKAQLYLTSVFSGTLGVKALNVELGFEGLLRETTLKNQTQRATNSVLTDSELMHYGINLRLFGKNIQDSSLVLKYGSYSLTGTAPQANTLSAEGRYYGGELQLYLWKAIGLESSFSQYLQAAGDNQFAFAGSRLEYSAFIEVSLVRLIAGFYQEEFRYDLGASRSESSERGSFAGVKLQF